MCDTFHPKKVFSRTDRELIRQFFALHQAEIIVDWSAKQRKLTADIYQIYLTLDDEPRMMLEQDLHEIHAVASSFGIGRDIHSILQAEGLALPEAMVGKTVQDQTMWVYLNANHTWCRIARFAHADKISESLWFSQKLIPLHEGDNLNSADPDTDALAHSISRYIVQKEGRGHHSYAEFFLRGGNDEYYFVYLNDYATVKMQCRQGQFTKGIDYASLEMVFIYHRDTQILEVKVTGDAAKKLEICRRFAASVQKCGIEFAGDAKPQYNIEHIQRRDFEFTVDIDGKMVSAKLYALCLSIRGCPGSKRLMKSSRGIFTNEWNLKSIKKCCLKICVWWNMSKSASRWRMNLAHPSVKH